MNPLQYYRTLVILNGAVPLLILAWDAYRGHLGANSVNYALHVTGILSLLFLFFSLAITPLKWISGWGGWIAFRRALGLYSFFYSVLHVVIYVGFDRALNLGSTLNEIWMRRFLQVGAAAVFLMIPLAVTSTNSMVRNLGPKRWKRLHQLAYLVAVLGVVHYYMLVKSDVRQPVAFGVVLAVLLGARFGRHYYELRQAAKKTSNVGRSPAAAMNFRSTEPVSNPIKRPWKGELKVAAIFQETHDVKTFRLTAVDGGALPFQYQPGQFLNLQLQIDGKRVNRSYTLASSPTRADACELSIKLDPQGHASRFMHDQITVGSLISVSGPAGKFVFTGKDSSAVFLIAGGVGITPAMSILRYLTDRAWSGEIYFLFVTKTEQDLIYEEELNWLQRRFSRLHICKTLTRTGPDSMWTGERGRATEALMKHFVPQLTQIPIYLCGPNEMMDATQTLLTGMGVPANNIKTERFTSRKSESSESNGSSATEFVDQIPQVQTSKKLVPPIETTSATVTFSQKMIRTKINVGTSVLEAAESVSIDIPYECRSGICGQCKTRLLEGQVSMECEDALSASEKAKGLILACQARPRSNVVVDA